MKTARKPSKYRAVKTEYNGVLYDSKAEAAYAEHLDLLARAGGIAWWIRQPTFRLGCPENVYKPDFLVVTDAGVYVVDVKGVETSKFKKDRRLWAKYGPCRLVIVKGKKSEYVDPEQKGVA